MMVDEPEQLAVIGAEYGVAGDVMRQRARDVRMKLDAVLRRLATPEDLAEWGAERPRSKMPTHVARVLARRAA